MNLKQQSHKLWLVALALAVVAGMLATPASASDRRLSVQVDEPFEIGGQLFAAGKLSLREVRELNPITVLTEVRVDGRSLGVMLAKQQSGPSSAQRDLVIFERSRHGHLVLASLALKGEPVRRLTTFGPSGHSEQLQEIASSSVKPSVKPTLVAAVQ